MQKDWNSTTPLTVAECRAHAKACRDTAARMTVSEKLEKIAELWDQLAAEVSKIAESRDGPGRSGGRR
jgi:hypothetical protein